MTFTMHDATQTLEQLSYEVTALRQRTADLEASEAVLQRAKEALRESEEKFSAIFHASVDVVMVIDGESRRILSVNRAAGHVLGYEHEALIGEDFSTLLRSPDESTQADELDSFPILGNVFTSQEVFCADGSVCPMDLTAAVIPWEKSEAILVTFRDVTERQRAELQLKETFTQLEQSRDDMLSILNQLELGTAMTDESGEITFLSQTCQRFLGLTPEVVKGKSWDQVYPFDIAEKAQLKAMCERPPRRRTRVPVHRETSDGQHYWLEVDVRDDPRDTRRKIFFLYDVSKVHDLRRLLDEKVQFHDLVGKSQPMQRIYRLIRDLAEVDATVLIEGDTGTGKELVARTIHFASHRRDKPFIPVNCAGLTESLMESQLFGHKRGAFTGAIADQQGFFEAADGGTLFLDEIGDMPLSVQTHLLRVLQEREITRIGESRPRKINVRVLVATHHNLSEQVAKGQFRVDLLYRIRVAILCIPLLCERLEDIPPLVGAFLGQYRAATGKFVQTIDSKAMRVLMDHTWPGNVRELQSAIEFAMIRCQGDTIRVEDLPPDLVSGAASRPFTTDDTVADEKQRLLAALKQTGGNRTAAARLLGIGRSTLYRRMESAGLTQP